MTVRRSQTALVLSALAGLTTPLTLALIFWGLGSVVIVLAEGAVRRFGISHSGVQFFFDAVVPCIDAFVCAAAFGVPLGILAGGEFLKCWFIFVLGAVVAHAVSALLLPSSLGGFWRGMETMLLPFWWLFFATLLGFLALTTRLRSRVRYVA